MECLGNDLFFIERRFPFERGNDLERFLEFMDFLEEVHADGLAHDGVFLIAHSFEIEFDGRRKTDRTDQPVRDLVEHAQRMREAVDHAETRMRKGKPGEKTSEHEPAQILVAACV